MPPSWSSRMYTGRADSENRIKELKEDLSRDTFCFQSFEATDAAFRLGCVAYNLLAGFRATVLPRCGFARRLQAVRDFVFLVGADLIPQGRRLQIRFAVPREERPEFVSRLRTLSEGLPIAAQLDWTLTRRVLQTHSVQPMQEEVAHHLSRSLQPLNPHRRDFLLLNPGLCNICCNHEEGSLAKCQWEKGQYPLLAEKASKR